ncbi:MAG: hypothetical protein DWQ04_23555 [Chloroflexi bacterium]|nr:MAG: hypothetical protein DWQ04_23555 [Chloroflexota bacterium]
MPQYRPDWIALAFTSLLFTAMLWGIMAIQQSEIREFRREGLPANATVRDRIKKTERSSSGGNTTVHELTVTFMDRSNAVEEDVTIDLEAGKFDFGTIDVGEFQRAKFHITRDSYDAINIGDDVAIVYLPDDPSTAKLAAEVTNWQPTVIQVFIGITIIVALAFFIRAITAPPKPPQQPSEFPEWESTG